MATADREISALAYHALETADREAFALTSHEMATADREISALAYHALETADQRPSPWLVMRWKHAEYLARRWFDKRKTL